jgi:electron transfer flavoprotein alpha subunit
MRFLVFLEHRDGELDRGSLGLLGKAVSLDDGEVASVLVGGPEVDSLAATASRFGAATVYVARGGSFEPPLSQPRVDVIDQIVSTEEFDTVLFSNSVLAADIAAGLAMRRDAGINWDLVDLGLRDGELTATRPALGDSVLVDVGWRSKERVALFRSGTFEPVASGEPAPNVKVVEPVLNDHSQRTSIVGHTPRSEAGPSLEGAEVIVSGGMGLGSAENFFLAEELARVLGGVVGATRAAVYAGWYPHSGQVGQTGRTVAPKLYFALGISGAVQHKVGMQNSKVIVAINKDPTAPIFEFSDLAVVGDVHSVVPRLVELIAERRPS